MVNLSNLRQITGGNKELELDLFNEFISSSGLLLKEMHENYAEENNEEWRRNAHALKGIAFNLGAYELAELAKQGQESYEANKNEKKHLLGQLDQTHQDVLAYLKKEMAD